MPFVSENELVSDNEQGDEGNGLDLIQSDLIG